LASAANDSLDADAKRKLQNRAAQRAFRERKEKHLADMEARVKVQDIELAELRKAIQRYAAFPHCFARYSLTLSLPLASLPRTKR
jgi:hypothetical protein